MRTSLAGRLLSELAGSGQNCSWFTSGLLIVADDATKKTRDEDL
jgi:hypothetical protein